MQATKLSLSKIIIIIIIVVIVFAKILTAFLQPLTLIEYFLHFVIDTINW